MDATIVVGTFGSKQWNNMGAKTANRLANTFGDVPVIHKHADGLAAARNGAISEAGSEWICIVDADDNLHPNYFKHMSKFADSFDLLAPDIRWVYVGTRRKTRVTHMGNVNILNQNPCCIGTVFRKSVWEEVGGFKNLPVLEDWEFFRRCYKNGARLKCVRGAEYIYNLKNDGRNSDVQKRRVIANKIRKNYYGD